MSCLGSNLTHQSTPEKFDIQGTFEQIINEEKWPITWPICPFPDMEKFNYANGFTSASGQNKPNNPFFGPHSLLKFGKWSLEVVHWVLPYVYAQSYTLLKLLLRSGKTSKPAKYCTPFPEEFAECAGTSANLHPCFPPNTATSSVSGPEVVRVSNSAKV